MSTAPACAPLNAGAGVAARPPRRRVVDAPTRMFHWLFALSFLGAYLSAESERWRALHVTLGYTLAGLLAFRVLWGLFGPRHARLGLLWRRLAGAPDWLRDAAAAARRGALREINARQAQNLLMALAVAALLVLSLPLTLSGYATYAEWGDAFGGVLGGEAFGELHEALGEAFLAVVLAHLALIVGLSLLRRRNQALPMLTGQLDAAGPDLVKRNHAALAVLLLVAVVAFFAWQWRQSPAGLLPANAPGWAQSVSSGSGSHHDDDD